MTDADPAVSVVVPTRDRPERLEECLAALEAQTAASYEIVVVDDGSHDAAAVAEVVAAAPHARLVRGHGRGPASARNLGAHGARARVICFTDDDCRPQPAWVESLARELEGGAHVVAGPTTNGRPDDVFAAASQAITNHLMAASLDPTTGQVSFAPTSNIACRVDVHRAVPFDETYPLAAGEDRDWCARLLDRGIAIEFVPEAGVSHHQDLSLRRFWAQQVRYGRGARRHHQERPRGARLAPPRFYVALLRRGFALGRRIGVLVVSAQVATAVGIVLEARRRPTPRVPSGTADRPPA